MLPTLSEFVSEIIALVTVIIVGLLWSLDMRRLLGLKTHTQEPENTKEKPE